MSDLHELMEALSLDVQATNMNEIEKQLANISIEPQETQEETNLQISRRLYDLIGDAEDNKTELYDLCDTMDYPLTSDGSDSVIGHAHRLALMTEIYRALAEAEKLLCDDAIVKASEPVWWIRHLTEKVKAIAEHTEQIRRGYRGRVAISTSTQGQTSVGEKLSREYGVMSDVEVNEVAGMLQTWQ